MIKSWKKRKEPGNLDQLMSERRSSFRIEEVEYGDGEVKYQVQESMLGMSWVLMDEFHDLDSARRCKRSLETQYLNSRITSRRVIE